MELVPPACPCRCKCIHAWWSFCGGDCGDGDDGGEGDEADKLSKERATYYIRTPHDDPANQSAPFFFCLKV